MVLSGIGQNAKYLPLLESYIKPHYEGWTYDSDYEPNSMYDAKVMSRDAKGNPAVLRGNFYTKKSKGYLLLLIKEGTVYGIIFSEDTMICIMPYKKMGAVNEPYSATEQKKFEQLQAEYLYEKVKAYQSAHYPPSTNDLNFLVSATHYVRETREGTITEYESRTTSQGTLIEIPFQKSIQYSVNVPTPGIKNVSDHVLVIRGIQKTKSKYGLSMRNISFSIEPGETHSRVPIYPAFDISIDDEPMYFGKVNKALTADIAKLKSGKPGKSDDGSDIENLPTAIRDGDILEVDSYTKATDIAVKKGDVLKISARGSVNLGTLTGLGGPQGISGFTQHNIISKFPHGALLGRVGMGDWINIGRQATIIAPVDGKLQLMINDADPSNNEGAFEVKVLLN